MHICEVPSLPRVPRKAGTTIKHKIRSCRLMVAARRRSPCSLLCLQPPVPAICSTCHRSPRRPVALLCEHRASPRRVPPSRCTCHPSLRVTCRPSFNLLPLPKHAYRSYAQRAATPVVYEPLLFRTPVALNVPHISTYGQ